MERIKEGGVNNETHHDTPAMTTGRTALKFGMWVEGSTNYACYTIQGWNTYSSMRVRAQSHPLSVYRNAGDNVLKFGVWLWTNYAFHNTTSVVHLQVLTCAPLFPNLGIHGMHHVEI